METASPATQSNDPINSQAIFTVLRDALAELYPEEQDARVVVTDSGLDAKQIAFSARAQTNWHNILAEAIRQNRLDALLSVVLMTYDGNTRFKGAVTQYHHFVEQGSVILPPVQLSTADGPVHSIATAGGTYIERDVTIKEGDFVGRDKSIYGDEVHGVKIVRDNVITTIGNYIKSPRTFYEDVRSLISDHPNILALLALLQVMLLLLFLRFKDQYISSCWENQYLLCSDVYILLVLLLFVIAVGWIGAQRVQRMASNVKTSYHVGWMTAAVVAGLAWTGLLGWQVWPIWHPERFAQDKFGIAIATFGSGSAFRASDDGYEISSRIYRQLDQAITNNKTLSNTVAIMRIGVIGDDSDQARRAGDIVDARLMVWGRLVSGGEKVDVHFKVMQDPDLMNNPAYPEWIPITDQAVENSITLAYKASDDMKKIIEQQSLGIAAFSLGLAQYHNRQFAEAARYFEDAIDRLVEKSGPVAIADYPNENIGLLYYYLGRCYQIQGRYEESQHMYEEAERSNSNDLAVLLGKSYNYRVFGEEEARLKTYQQILDLTSARSDIPSLYNRMIALDALNQKRRALEGFLSIIKQEPNFYIAYLGAGRLLVEQNRLDEAREIYNEAAKLAEGNRVRQIWLELGRSSLYEKEEHIQEAIEAIKRAIELDHDHLIDSLYYYLALLYANEKRVDEAIDSYEKLTSISSLPSWSHRSFGAYLASENRCQEAVSEFEKALEHPAYNNTVLYAQLGLAYTCLAQQQGKHQLAKESQQKAVNAFAQATSDADCTEAWVRHEYGRSLYQFGRLEDAITQFKRVLPTEETKEICPIDLGLEVKTLRNLGQIYEEKDELGEARMIYEQVMTLCEENEPAVLLARVDFEILSFVKGQLEKLGGDTSRCFSLFRG